MLAIAGLLLVQSVDQALAGVVVPSGAGTLTIGPQSMEGNLQIHPGDTIKAGYDFTMPGAHAAAQVTVDNASITMALTCSNGTAPTLTFPLPVQSYTDPAGSSSWYPSGDQSNAAVYQGSVTAPDLCAGGVMSDAAGATFKATIFSTDTTDKVNFRFHYSDNTSGSWSATITASPTPTAKTVATATLTPSLGLTLAVDKSSAIPGDTLTYSGTVTNTGATLTLGGDFTASATGTTTATVKSYWDDVATSPDSTSWVPLAGTAAAQTGYTPAVAPPSSSGLTLTSTAVSASGVSYPTSGDPLLGTTLAAGSSALWHYTAAVPLTPSQVTTLLDPTKTKAIRNSFHLEVSPANPNITQPSIINVDFSGIFLGATPAPSGAVTNITVTVQPPTGAAVPITSTQVSGLASLAPGSSANYSATFQVPTVPAKAGTETDAAYTSRLQGIDGTILSATASASGSSTGGNVTAAAPQPANTTEHLPIMAITKSGPATLVAGTTGTYPLALQNFGGASASGMAITDSVPNGGTGTVSGIPAGLAAGASATGSSGPQATFQVPVQQSAGSLTDTATLTWQDANANSYGPVSSMFTTQIQAANKLAINGTAGPNPTGANETVKATLTDVNGQPIANTNVTLNVSGANTLQMTVATDATGVANFSYAGSSGGTDIVQAMSVNGVQSNTITVTWFTPIQKVSSTVVQGNFYAEPSNPQSFVVTPQSVPDFAQTFPTVNFDPPANTIPHSPPGVPTDATRPFTDVTTDINGNYNGTIIAQGNNQQAGVGNMTNFDAVFTANMIVAQAGDVTLNFNVDDGFMFGVGNNATRVSGSYENAPSSNVSAIQGYPLMGAWNQTGSGVRSVTVHFPAAGTYPYEIDYFEASGGGLSLTMSVATFTAQTNPLSIYVGYADGLRAAGSVFPYPWQGSPNVTFMGCCPAYDAGAVRFDNSSNAPIVLDSVTVDVGGAHWDLWGRNLTVPPNQILILTQNNGENFDTSDYSSAGCGGNNGVIPKVNVTISGVTTSYNDTNQILNTFGYDLACRGNESQSWQRIGGGGNTINVPLPPATNLALTPATVTGDTVGQTQTFTVAAMDATGAPVANLPVTMTVTGANGFSGTGGAFQVNGTTDAAGMARLSYVGTNAGTDTVQVKAFVMGLQALSNSATVPWSLSSTPAGGTAPAPAITSPSPVDGAVVTKPVPISASFAPPAGQTITSWSVSYQSQAPSAPVTTIFTGTGTPPATLGTFDPTLLPNGNYTLTISATASGGGIQTLGSGVTVAGNLKLGRYVTTYQDLSVPAGGVTMEVRRVYDSADKLVGDFGVGWRLNLANFRVTTNRVLGAGGWTQFNSFCGIGLCLTSFRTSAPHYVTVTFPDGHEETFDFTPTGGTNVFGGGGAAFTARAGTTSTLQALGDTSLTYLYDGNLYGGNGLPYNPTQFKLTTLDGRALVLDTASGLVSQTDRNGNTLNIDATGVHASNGQSISYTRDATGRISQITGPTGQQLLYNYSAAGDLASSTDPDGNVVTYGYDTNHDLLSATGPGATTPLEKDQYDSSGRLISVTDGNGHTTTLTNDVSAQQQTVTDPLGKVTSVLGFDALGDLVQRDELFSGRTVTDKWTYDNLGRPLSHTDPLGHTTSAGYDGSGDITQFTDADNNTFKYSYNAFGQRTGTIGADGTVLETRTYDGSGNLTQLKTVDGAVTSYQYAANGKLTQITNALNQTIQIGYDTNGHLASLVDAAGNAMSFSIDASGRMASATDANGATTHYSYDGNGNLVGVTDANNHSWSAQYDYRGDLVSVKDPLGNIKTYTYDAAFQPLQITDRNGQVTTYAYDANEQMVKKTLPGGDVTSFTFDPLGRLVDSTNSTADVKMTYDDAGRLISQTTSGTGVAQPTVTLTYSYDAKGNRTSMSGPDGTTSYSFNPYSELTSLSDPSGGVYQFSYDSALRLTGITRPNGVADQLSYDAVGDLISRNSTKGGSTLASASYVLDSTGHRTSETDLSGTTTFTHDAGGQLTGATPPGGTGGQSFTYDGAGNRTSATGVPASSIHYDAANHLLTYGSTTYAYDSEGNLVKKTDPSGTTTYTWNADHRLVSIQNPDSTTTTFRYDPLGRRIEVQGASQDTRYAYDGTNIHLEYNGANQLQASYTDGSGLDTVLAMNRGGSSYYYSADGLNSTTALTDASGAVVQRDSYDAFGGQTQTGNVTNPFTYSGRELDSSGLYYMRARYYDPGTGRFLSEDPSASANQYPYAANDPVDFADPSGTQAFAERAITGAFSGAVFALVSQIIVQLIAHFAYGCSFNFGALFQAVILGALAGGLFGAGAAGVSFWLFRALFGGMIGFATAGIQIALDAASGKPDTPQQQIELLTTGFVFGALGGATSNWNIFNLGRNATAPTTAAETSFMKALGGDFKTGAGGFVDSQFPGDLIGTFVKGAAGC